MSNFFIKGSLTFLLALFLTWAYLVMPLTFFSLNNNLRDFLFNIRGELPKNDNIVIIDIDETALKHYGQWPWPRSVVSELIQKLSDSDAGIIGLDIVFAETDKTSPHSIASKIGVDASSLDNYDNVLAKTLSNTKTVGGYVFKFDEKIGDETPLIPATFIQDGLKNNNYFLEPIGIVPNINVLQDSLHTSGFFNNIPDEDGVIRRVPLLLRYEGVVYPSLALEMVRFYSDISKVKVKGDDFGVFKIAFGDFSIPTDYAGRMIVNYRGPKNHFTYISAADILNNNFDKKDVAGKFVFVGTSAVGLFDLRATPFDSAMPGVEVHANVLDNILKQDFLFEPVQLVLYDLAMIWAIIFVLIMLFSYITPWFYVPASIVSGYLLFQMLFYAFFEWE